MSVIINTECFDCGAPAVEHHHVVPRSLGGKRTVPLCVRCHDLIHGGLGEGRIHHKELTTRALNRKDAMSFHYIWWFYYKEKGTDDWKDVKEIASDLEQSVATVRNKLKRIEEMDSTFLAELCLPYIGYEYYDTSVFDLEPYNISERDYVRVVANRELIDKNILEDLAIPY